MIEEDETSEPAATGELFDQEEYLREVSTVTTEEDAEDLTAHVQNEVQ